MTAKSERNYSTKSPDRAWDAIVVGSGMGGMTTAERRELAELRRENRRLREGVEMLLRATAILATGDPGEHLSGQRGGQGR